MLNCVQPGCMLDSSELRVVRAAAVCTVLDGTALESHASKFNSIPFEKQELSSGTPDSCRGANPVKHRLLLRIAAQPSVPASVSVQYECWIYLGSFGRGSTSGSLPYLFSMGNCILSPLGPDCPPVLMTGVVISIFDFLQAVTSWHSGSN